MQISSCIVRKDIYQLVDVDGSSVRVMTRPGSRDQGHPLVLINGIGARLEMWQPFCDASFDRTIVMFDIPGITGTPGRSFPPTMAGIAKWLTRLLDVLNIQQPDVMGFSWGGLLAQQMAREAPERVRSLVLASTNFGFGALHAPDALQLLHAIPGIGSDDPWVILATALGGAPSILDPVELIGNALNPATSSFIGYQYQIAALAGWTSLPWLHEIRQPTLVIAGEDDSFIPRSTSRQLANAIPNATLTLLAAGGHLLPVNQPQALARTVDTFLQG